MASVHIGNKIKTVVKSKGITVSEFGRRIMKSRENVYSIFQRESIDTGLLATISEILEHDFFLYYTEVGKEKSKLKEEVENLKDMIKMLKEKSS